MPDPSSTTAADPSPRYATVCAAAVYAVCTLILAYPVFAGRFLVTDVSDQYIGGFPVREFGAEALRSTGGFAQWNPYIFGGLPYVAAMHGDIFYPTFLLRMIMRTDLAMTWAFIIHVFLCGLFTYLFLRAVRVGLAGALVGGIAYMMSGQIAGLVSPGHDGKLYVSALLPLALLLLYRIVREGRLWAWGPLALTIGLAVLSPHPQLLQYMLLLAGAWSIYLVRATEDGPRRTSRDAFRRLGLALAAVVVGGVIGAIQYVPVVEYIPWSPRAGGLSGYERAVSYSMPPEELLNTYLPQFTGILDRYWGRNGIHLHSEYLGAAALFLAFAAFGTSRRGFLWFWLGTIVVSVLWSLGGFTPFYHLVYALVPGTKFFRAPSTIMYITALGTSVLVAIGTERLLAGRIRPRYAYAWLGIAAGVALIATVGGLTNLAGAVAGPERYEYVLANAGALLAGAWRSFAFVAAVAAVSIAFGRRALDRRGALAALAAVVALDLWSVERLYWNFSAPASVLYAADPAIDYMKRQPQPGRVVALELQGGDAPAFHDPFLSGDAFMVHGIRQLTGYHGNQLGRFGLLTGWGTADWPREIANPNLRQLENVRYLYTNVGQPLFDGMTRVLGPVKNSAGSTVYLYQFPDSSPVAWVTAAIVKAPDDAAAATVLDPRFPVRSVAVFDTGAAVQGRTDLRQPPAPPAIAVTATRYQPGRITLALAAPAPAGSALVVSENYYPGWTATANGRAAAVGRADVSLIGVALPTGATTVDLSFASPTYERGKLLSLGALALALVMTGVGVAVDRRRRA